MQMSHGKGCALYNLIDSRQERAKKFLRLMFQTRQLANSLAHRLNHGAKCGNAEPRTGRADLGTILHDNNSRG